MKQVLFYISALKIKYQECCNRLSKFTKIQIKLNVKPILNANVEAIPIDLQFPGGSLRVATVYNKRISRLYPE